MSVRATVIIPTHDHGSTLRYAAASALAQTVSDLEVFIVGDGASDDTREVALMLEKDDERVRFFDNPKGPRHGETHRHAALLEARGKIVCYLSDDDLWFPEHVERLADALRDADFAHASTMRVRAGGTIETFLGDVGDPRTRQKLLSRRWNFIPLSAAAHTMDAYRRLPEGWRTSPEDVWTDLHMWRQFLAEPWCRAVSIPAATVVHFASTDRPEATAEERLRELAAFAVGMTDPGRRAAAALQVHEPAIADARAELIRTGDRVDALEAQRDDLAARIRSLNEALSRTRLERDELRGIVVRLRGTLERMRGSATWRLRGRLLRLPVLGAWRRRRAATARSPREPR